MRVVFHTAEFKTNERCIKTSKSADPINDVAMNIVAAMLVTVARNMRKAVPKDPRAA